MRRGEIRCYRFQRPDRKRPDGMPRECAVNLDHLQTVPKRRIGQLIVTLPSHRMTEVRAALLFALGFDRT